MPNFTYHTITITGVDSGEEDQEDIALAHAKACSLFEPDLVSALTSTGHNGLRSFCVFPNGSGNERETQLMHQLAIVDFVEFLKKKRAALDWFLVYWSDHDMSAPKVISSHDTE